MHGALPDSAAADIAGLRRAIVIRFYAFLSVIYTWPAGLAGYGNQPVILNRRLDFLSYRAFQHEQRVNSVAPHYHAS